MEGQADGTDGDLTRLGLNRTGTAWRRVKYDTVEKKDQPGTLQGKD